MHSERIWKRSANQYRSIKGKLKITYYCRLMCVFGNTERVPSYRGTSCRPHIRWSHSDNITNMSTILGNVRHSNLNHFLCLACSSRNRQSCEFVLFVMRFPGKLLEVFFSCRRRCRQIRKNTDTRWQARERKFVLAELTRNVKRRLPFTNRP